MSEPESEAETNVSQGLGSLGTEAQGTDPSFRGGASSEAGEPSAFLWEMAKMWVEEHQKPTMLGAFAVGVVVGSLFRD